MTDLERRSGDRNRAVKAGTPTRWTPGDDRARSFGDRWWPLALVLLAGCPKVIEPPRPAPRLVIDAFAPGGGDGSNTAPLRSIPSELPPAVELILRSGLYQGPLQLPRGARVLGRGEAVVYLEGAGTVLSGEDLTLESLSVQGGSVGVATQGRTRLTKVHLSGHRTAGVEVGPQGLTDISESQFEGTIPETTAVRTWGGAVRVVGSTFRGAFRRALEVRNGTAALVGCTVQGPSEALHTIDSNAVIRHTSVAGGRGQAIYAARGTLQLEQVSVVGHEYGLLAAPGSQVRINGFTVQQPLVAGVSLLGSRGELAHVTVEGAGPHGGLEFLDSHVVVSEARITKAQALGVFVRQGRVTLGRVEVAGVRAEGSTQGDGVHIRDAQVDASSLFIRDVEGAAVLATASAKVNIGQLVSERAVVAALVSERHSRVEARSIVSIDTRGPAVAVPDEAAATIDSLEVRGGGTPVWAECSQGARVEVGVVVASAPLPPSACVVQRPPVRPP